MSAAETTAIFTWGIHELAHWLTGVGLGYEMWITFNQAGPVDGSYDSTTHRVLVSMAGPAITWVQGVVALILIQRTQTLWLYALLFLAFWIRAVAMGISYISNPNDEAVASTLLGLPMWVLPTASVLFLLVLTYKGSKRLNVGWKGNILCYLCASIVTTIIVFSDQWLF